MATRSSTRVRRFKNHSAEMHSTPTMPGVANPVHFTDTDAPSARPTPPHHSHRVNGDMATPEVVSSFSRRNHFKPTYRPNTQ